MSKNNKNISIGKYGENLTKKYLIRQKYHILGGHWQKRVGEIDVIANDPKTKEIVFVEVKTRSSIDFGYPEEKVTHSKIIKLQKTAQLYLIDQKYPESQRWRIDVIGIIKLPNSTKINLTHFKNISPPS